ncbi:MAG: ATP-dependent DNA helicase RecG [Clostridia bacterium]|nr:ATP-dependent DNA helicase RecG [Clostridia bacterium]
MINRDTGITSLPGIGEVRAAAFARLGIFTAGDLVRHYPRGYQRRGDIRAVRDAVPGEPCAFLLTVGTAPTVRTMPGRGRMTITKFSAYDESGKIEISYFNQPYRAKSFNLGDTFRFWGKIEIFSGRRQLANPISEPYTEGVPLPEFVPVYSLSEGLTQKLMASSVDGVLAAFARDPGYKDPVPPEIREKYDLCDRLTALRRIHFPGSYEDIESGRRTLVFDELLRFSLCISLSGKGSSVSPAAVMEDADELAGMFCMSLPFSPTGAQRRAIADIAKDMASGRRMDRLVCGDVGSGKTLCAEAAAFIAAKNGFQTAFLAPTEVLAAQHYRNLTKVFEPLGVRVGLLTGSTKAAERRKLLEELRSGEIDVLTGTHALLSEGVDFARLGLAVTDEQHRFGVRQRTMLSSGGDGLPPHILVMSATPIPRTLALMLYGDLKASMIDELPPGRQKIDTYAVGSGYHERLIAFIRRRVGEGRQVYVICPAVGSLEKEIKDDERVTGQLLDLSDLGGDSGIKLKSAVEYGKQLKKELPELSVGILHGKMKPQEKDKVMRAFAGGEISVLVSTTVIEVGVDVPNASLIIIENAERFGLSQLHQLRGRVGRGSAKSYCVLVSDAESEQAKKRLSIMKETNDGFKIAETDLQMRGPGEFFPAPDGSAMQHGALDLGLASLCDDTGLLEAASEAAKSLLADDPRLEKPENAALAGSVSEALKGAYDALN